MITAEEILAKAADLVEEGWCQGRLWTWRYVNSEFQHGDRCALGALYDAAGIRLNSMQNGFVRATITPAAEAAYRAICREIGRDVHSGTKGQGPIADWNNEPERDQMEVATTLRNAKRWL